MIATYIIHRKHESQGTILEYLRRPGHRPELYPVPELPAPCAVGVLVGDLLRIDDVESRDVIPVAELQVVKFIGSHPAVVFFDHHLDIDWYVHHGILLLEFEREHRALKT